MQLWHSQVVPSLRTSRLQALPQAELCLATTRSQRPQTPRSLQTTSPTRRPPKYQRTNRTQGKVEAQKTLPTSTQSSTSTRSNSKANTLPSADRHPHLRLSRCMMDQGYIVTLMASND